MKFIRLLLALCLIAAPAYADVPGGPIATFNPPPSILLSTNNTWNGTNNFGILGANSAAFGGCVIATDALCATGNGTISGTLTAGSFSPTSATIPTNGWYSSAANAQRWSTAGSARLQLDASGNFRSLNGAGWFLAQAAGSATVPNISPNVLDLTSGLGGLISAPAIIVASVTRQSWDATGTKFGGTIPTITGTGTPTITTGSTDTAGEVTSGISATSVVITFSATKTNAPFCTVTPQTQLLAFAYTISTSAITITQTATTGEKIDYVCFQH